ncbi:hypothetical protein [Ochrobactrum soli]|nr:hypothetical protein [[Ochrobactrum] soli]
MTRKQLIQFACLGFVGVNIRLLIQLHSSERVTEPNFVRSRFAG